RAHSIFRSPANDSTHRTDERTPCKPERTESSFLNPIVSCLIKRKSVLTLCQGKLRCKLHVDHQADATVKLKKSRRFLSRQDFPKDGHVPLTKFCQLDVRVQPSTNQIFSLLISQGSVVARILFNDRRSRVVDLPGFRRILFVHLPELSRFLIREYQVCCNQLLLDRANVLAKQRKLLIRDRVRNTVSGGRF